jgi:hypothetical protein
MKFTYDQVLAAYRSVVTCMTQNTGEPDWTALQNAILGAGLPPAAAMGILSSLVDNRSAMKDGAMPIRILHPIEVDLLTSEAYGHFLTAVRLGLIGMNNVESLIEELAGVEPLPIQFEALERAIARRWRFHLRNYYVH